jgi:2-aminoadipate transaminase
MTTIRTVPVDDDGMVVEVLPQVLDELRAEGCTPKLVATIPTFHAPTGTVLPVDRRRALVEMADEHEVMVLEDDCDHPFGYDAAPPPTLGQRPSGPLDRALLSQ